MEAGSPTTRRLVDISPRAFEHPADRAATAALKAIPLLDVYVRKLIEMQYERAFRQSLLASSVRLGPSQLPRVWERQLAACSALDMPDEYDLYLTQWPLANAAAIGAAKPMILVHSELVALADDDELQTVLGHELGHILAEHVLYRTALLILVSLSGLGRLPAFAGLPVLAIRHALLEWSRAAELSCDRAATLVNRDPLVTCRTLMVLAGGAASRELDLDAFLAQAQQYEDWDSGWDRFTRALGELSLTHAYPVRRVAELMKWVRSGDYDRILSGDYIRRGDPVDVRAEASDAVQHYTDRFRTIFQEAGETVERAGGRLTDWLRGGAGD